MSVFETFKLRKRVQELQEEMLKLTRIVETRDLDWQDMRARCKRLLDRTEKAAQAIRDTEQGEDASAEASQPTADVLSPRHSTIQQRILARRRANGILPPTG